VSWAEAAARALRAAGASVEEGPRGLAVSFADSGARLLVVVRRLHMSLDRKVEVLGVFEVERGHPLAAAVLRRMVASSFEVEARGFLRPSFAWRGWRELRRLEPVVGPVAFDASVAESVRGYPGLAEALRSASPDLVEVFPEIMPPSYTEAFLTAPGAPLTPYIASLIQEYLREPERLAWCYRAQFLYGSPRMPQKIVRNCQLAVIFERALREATQRLLQCTASSPRTGGSST